ncbi:hypothetical protein B0H16DRAFT_1346596 [Mycena metata]|uniref:Uncharacterized protein n=1 Tax=Mycena metata TaxID=1033252 RepID=A0AAD7GT42_9AGAR|nr:hypothetical protein B0H16DRAFT_1346596 [Mycena metata]
MVIDVARKYGVQFDAPHPSMEIKAALPLWHSFGENRSITQLNNKNQCKCLRMNHGAHTIGDAVKIAERLEKGNHSPHRNCGCLDCTFDRDIRGCLNLHSCATVALRR